MLLSSRNRLRFIFFATSILGGGVSSFLSLELLLVHSSLRRRSFARTRGDRLNRLDGNGLVLWVQSPNHLDLHPRPLFRHHLRVQLVHFVRSLQHESSAALFHAVSRATGVGLHF